MEFSFFWIMGKLLFWFNMRKRELNRGNDYSLREFWWFMRKCMKFFKSFFINYFSLITIKLIFLWFLVLWVACSIYWRNYYLCLLFIDIFWFSYEKLPYNIIYPLKKLLVDLYLFYQIFGDWWIYFVPVIIISLSIYTYYFFIL